MKKATHYRNGLAFHLHFYQTHTGRHLIPCSAFECSSCSLLLHAAQLLEEKWDFGSQALMPNIRDHFVVNSALNCAL